MKVSSCLGRGPPKEKAAEVGGCRCVWWPRKSAGSLSAATARLHYPLAAEREPPPLLSVWLGFASPRLRNLKMCYRADAERARGAPIGKVNVLSDAVDPFETVPIVSYITKMIGG